MQQEDGQIWLGTGVEDHPDERQADASTSCLDGCHNANQDHFTTTYVRALASLVCDLSFSLSVLV